jgi:hypothetical protein
MVEEVRWKGSGSGEKQMRIGNSRQRRETSRSVFGFVTECRSDKIREKNA